MKENKSFFAKIVGKNVIEPETGDIFYFRSPKCYWIYLGSEVTITNTDEIKKNWKDIDVSSDGKVHAYTGLDAVDIIRKLVFDRRSMFKANDDIIFHYKFKHDRSIQGFNEDIKSGNAMYIMTLKQEDFTILSTAFNMYKIEQQRS